MFALYRNIVNGIFSNENPESPNVDNIDMKVYKNKYFILNS